MKHNDDVIDAKRRSSYTPSDALCDRGGFSNFTIKELLTNFAKFLIKGGTQ